MELQQLLVLVLPGALSVVGLLGAPWIAGRIKERSEKAISDAEIAMRLRDELRADLEAARERIVGLGREVDALRDQVRDCEEDRNTLRRDIGIANDRISRLEDQVRKGGADGNLGRAGGLA